MINYLSLSQFLNYDISKKPSENGGGGGMSTKTVRVLQAVSEVYPSARGIHNTSDIEFDLVLVEPLRFTLHDQSETAESVEVVLGGLQKHKKAGGHVVLYCSEMTLLRMQPQLRERVLSACEFVTANCKFQANLFKYIDVKAKHILCDPIPDSFVSKGNYFDRHMRVVATGRISWEKNAMQVIEVFKALKGVVERAYVGSASLWNDTTDQPGPQKLQEEVYGHCDHIVREATTEGVAAEFQQARFGLWVAYHDTFATSAHEMIMAGVPVVAAKHGLASEIPVWPASGVVAQVEAIKRLVAESDEALSKQSQTISKWAVENVSYKAFQEQLKEVLQAVW